MQKNNKKKSQFIFEISLCGFLVSMLVIVRAIFKFVDIINGFSPQIQFAIYAFGIIMLQSYWYKIGFYLLAPFVTMIFGISGNIFLDYLIPYYGFFLFLFFTKLTNNFYTYTPKNVIYVNSLLVLFNFVSYSIVSISYISSGVIFYQANFYTSFIINFPIVVISCCTNMLIMFFCTFPILNLIRRFREQKKW